MKGIGDITSDDIDRWADTIGASADLPVLLRRLLLATASVAQIDFPGDGGTRLGGWDGRVTASSSGPFWPSGSSGWEITVQKATKKKADADHKKRADTLKAGASEQPAAYVAVTARRYGRKKAWAAAKKSDGPWADVRLLDAEDLATWLSIAPAVHAWFARRLGRPVGEFLDPDEFRRQWSARTSPPLPSRMVVTGKDRKKNVEELQLWMQSTPKGVLYVHGDTREEAALFVAEVLSGASMEQLGARAIILGSSDAWNWAAAAQSATPLVLIPDFPEFDPGAALGVNAAVIVPVGPEVGVTGPGHLILAPIPFEPAARVLVESGWDEGTAEQLIAKSGAKLAALQRLCGYVRRPGWLSVAAATETATLLLLGTWVQGRPNDEAIAMRFQLDPARIEATCLALASAPGRPVTASQDRFGPRCWRWSSPGEAWAVLGPSVSASQLASFRDAVIAVLSADDPRYSLPKERRVYANIEGKVLPNSAELRDGLARSVAWLSISDEHLQTAHGPDAGSTIADRLVRELLVPAWLRWASLSELLPILAEAAPNAFLDALEKSLALGADGVVHLFEEEDSSPFGGSSPHTGLLWALETLAWSEKHVARACLALAQLAANDPPGERKLANRPARSLAAALHPGIPQSATSASDRVAITRTIIRTYPGVAWSLMLGELEHSGGGIVSTTRAPQIRSWKVRGDLVSTSVAEYDVQLRAWVDELIAMSNGDIGRLIDLIAISRFLSEEQERPILERVRGLVAEKDRRDPEGEVWAALRREIFSLYLVARGGEVQDPARLARLQSLYDALTPADVARQYAWLFHGFPNVPARHEADHELRKRRDARLRDQALDRLRASGNPRAALGSLAALATDPLSLGEALARSADAEDLVREILDGTSRLPIAVAATLLVIHAGRQPTGWIAEVLQGLRAKGTQGEIVLQVLRCMPPENATWDLVDAMGPDVREQYWTSVRWATGEDSQECERAIAAFLAVGRPGLALQTAGQYSESINPDTALQVLEAIRDAPDRDVVRRDLLGGMFGYYLAKVFLRADESQAEMRLAQLEIVFFRVLEDSERPPKIIFAALATQPALFAQMVAWIYREESDSDQESAADENPGEGVIRRAEACSGILAGWDGVPGERASSPEDRDRVLLAWANEALRLTSAQRRTESGLSAVAEVLARAPAGEDGAWPAVAARQLLESGAYPDLSDRMWIAKRNARGITTRGHLVGGDQERDLAATFHGWASTVRAEWPRTAALLDRLAEDYEREARQHDEGVLPDRLKHGE